MGIPEMAELWNRLQNDYRSASISKNDLKLYKKWHNALVHLSQSPNYRGLHTHDMPELTKRYGIKVWQSYLENKTSKAMRMFWVYGPDKKDITIIGLDPHPESKKNGAYKRIRLSNMPND